MATKRKFDGESADESVERSERAAEASEQSAAIADEAADDAARSAASSARSAEQTAQVESRARAVAAGAHEREVEQAALTEFGVDPEDPELQQEFRKLEAGATEQLPYGEPGNPIARTSPFTVGFLAALGVLAAAALAWATVVAGPVLVLVGLSLFLAVGLDPAVSRLVRRGLSRRSAVAVVASAVGVAMVAFVVLGLPPLIRQANTLRTEAPRYAEQLTETSPTIRELDRRFDLVGRLREMTVEPELLEGDDEAELVGLARGAITAAAATLTVLVLTLYFLASLPRARIAAERLVPRSRRARAGLLTEGVVARIGGYVLGNVLTGLVAGVAAFVVLIALGVPQAVALAILVAITDIIPIIGALLGAAVATAVALTVSMPTGLAVLAFFVVYQQFENLWLMPRVMKQTVDISPAVTLVSALIGGALFGMLGALLAIPVAAAVKLIIEHVLVPAQESR